MRVEQGLARRMKPYNDACVGKPTNGYPGPVQLNGSQNRLFKQHSIYIINYDIEIFFVKLEFEDA